MKCPFALEPHQIQGLDFIGIYPVIQFLVKQSVYLRNEKAERLKMVIITVIIIIMAVINDTYKLLLQFAIGQFHNHFYLSSSEKARIKRTEVLKAVKRIEDLYAAKRQFKRKQNAEPEDDRSRVRLTLLEYGIKNIPRSVVKSTDPKVSSFEKENLSEEIDQDEVMFWFSN